jgi:Protein of unknown function (DUF3768)
MEAAMDVESPTRLAEIRRLNDEFRTTFRGGRILFTGSVAALPAMVKAALLGQIASFISFQGNASEERDYGSFEYCNREISWKIEYWDLNLVKLSEDPADPAKTNRPMIVGLRQDW